jgi:FkbM family methyltransferase
MNFLSDALARDLYVRFLLKRPRLRRWITGWLLPDEDVTVSLFGAELCINKQKEPGCWNASQLGEGAVIFRDEAATLLNLAMVLQPGDTFVDVGANVGLYSKTLSRFHRLFPDSAFYAFEANPDTSLRLRRTLEGTGVFLHESALSDRSGTLPFCRGATSGVFGPLANSGEFQIASDTVELQVSRLDEFAVEGSSLVIKIDVEGHEIEVLRGAVRFFQENRVKAVYLDGYSSDEVPAFLHSHGMKILNGVTLEPVAVPERRILAIRPNL